MGTWWILQKIATGKIGDVSPMPSDKIGELVVKENNQLAYLGMPAQASYLGICIVLTMDMDFCHIDGYEGLEIYFHDTDLRGSRRLRLGSSTASAGLSERTPRRTRWR